MSFSSGYVRTDLKIDSQLMMLPVLMGGQSKRRDYFISLTEDVYFSVCVCICAHLDFICSRRIDFDYYKSGQVKKG